MMIKKLLIVVACLFVFSWQCIFSVEQFLHYSICPVTKDEKKFLEVHLTFQGNEGGITEIVLPSSSAGQEELYAEIKDLHCLTPQASIENTEEPHIKRIHHLSSRAIQITYKVGSSERKREGEWYYRPLVESSYFFFSGHAFFVTPRMDMEVPTKISVEWKNFPTNWTLANSFGAKQHTQLLTLPFSKFQHAVYTGGDFQLIQCGQESSPIFIAIQDKWSFSPKRFTELVQTVLESQRHFWNDFAFPYYLITVLPTGDSHFMGGTGTSNAFSIFVGDLYDDNIEDYKWLAWLLSHENFHTWNGTEMRSGPPEGSLYWFTEGFTEYYAVKLNHKNKLIDNLDYFSHINNILYDYYTSTAHDAKNERIQKDFWNDRDVQRLPYVRGFLLAWKWDKKIQQISNGVHSLDDCMIALRNHLQNEKRAFTQDDIIQVVSAFLPLGEVQNDVTQYILEGKTLIPEDEDEYSITWIENIGFDTLPTVRKKRIEGVKADKIFAAGLRNGQKFLSYTISDQTISVSIEDREGKIQEITYPLDGNLRKIPQYITRPTSK